MKVLFLALGIVSLSLGAIGIVVPGLPTTPFLLLAAALFLRSSETLYNRLVSSRLLGSYIRRFRASGGMTLRIKIVSMTIMWVMIAVSVCTVKATATRLAIASVGVVGTIVMGWFVRTARRD